MTEEELNRLEALAIGVNIERFDAGWYAPAKIESIVGKDAEFIAAASPATIISLIALARVGLAVTTWKIPQTVSLSRAGGVEGPSIYLNDYRITGPKPWGGATSMEDFKPVETRQIFAALGFPLSSLPKPGGE